MLPEVTQGLSAFLSESQPLLHRRPDPAMHMEGQGTQRAKAVLLRIQKQARPPGRPISPRALARRNRHTAFPVLKVYNHDDLADTHTHTLCQMKTTGRLVNAFISSHDHVYVCVCGGDTEGVLSQQPSGTQHSTVRDSTALGVTPRDLLIFQPQVCARRPASPRLLRPGPGNHHQALCSESGAAFRFRHQRDHPRPD